MPYFILIPVFLGWLLICGIATTASKWMASLRPWRSYVVQVCVWSTVGILIANSVLVLLLAQGIQALDALRDGTTIRSGLQVAWGLGALLGPFAVSALGWMGGVCFGLYLAHQRRR